MAHWADKFIKHANEISADQSKYDQLENKNLTKDERVKIEAGIILDIFSASFLIRMAEYSQEESEW
jgi:hypothetical protein